MCNAWNHSDSCTCGWGGEGHLGSSTGGWWWSSAAVPASALWAYRDSFCHPTRCPRCGAAVYFVRHNGGCVWLDELGWPWPKHACFDERREARWSSVLRSSLLRVSPVSAEGTGRPKSYVGIVVDSVEFTGQDPRIIALTLEFEMRDRVVVVIPAEGHRFFLGEIVVIFPTTRQIVFSNGESRRWTRAVRHLGELKVG